MNFELALQSISDFYSYPPQAASEARSLLLRYHTEGGFTSRYNLSQEEWLRWYNAVSILTCLGMKDEHRNDPKRRDRSFGQRLRKKRTGSRRG